MGERERMDRSCSRRTDGESTRASIVSIRALNTGLSVGAAGGSDGARNLPMKTSDSYRARHIREVSRASRFDARSLPSPPEAIGFAASFFYWLGGVEGGRYTSVRICTSVCSAHDASSLEDTETLTNE